MSHHPTLDLMKLPLNGRLLIEASAGTGKTYSLSALYVRFILGIGTPVEPNSNLPGNHKLTPQDILVLTFTNAATEELRDRIRQRLEHSAKVLAPFNASPDNTDLLEAQSQALRNEDGFLDDLHQHLTALYHDDEKALGAMARRCRQAAQNMDQAAIYTLHGFCQKALKRFAFAAGQPFEQMLEPDANSLVECAYQDYWRTLIQPLSATLAGALTEAGIRTPTALKQQVDDAQETIALYDIQDGLIDNQLPDDLLNAESAIKQANASKLAAQQAFDEHEQTITDWLTAEIAAGNLKKATLGKGASKDLSVFISEGKYGSHLNKFTPEGLEEQIMAKKTVSPTPLISHCFDLMQAFLTTRDDASLPTDSLLAHASRWTKAHLEHQLSTQAQITYDSMVENLARALDASQSNLAGTLAQQLRRAYPCTLIDEFQDTDANQYAIFSAMYQNQPTDSYAWLMIGDPKQAIYGFRGADINTYLRAKQETDVQRTLDKNFRASARLIAATNALFSQSPLNNEEDGLFGSMDIPFEAVRYRDGEIPTPQDKDAALVLYQLNPADFPGDVKSGHQNFNKDVAIKQLANQMAYRAHALLTEQHYQPEQLAVLVRDHTEATATKHALQQTGIESVYLSDRTSIYHTPEAADLLTLLKAINAPQDGSLLRTALATRLMAYSLFELDTFAPKDDATTDQELAWQQRIQIFQQLKKDWQQHGVLAMIQRLVNRLKLTRRVPHDNAERCFTNLFHLAELLQKAAQRHVTPDAQLAFFENAISMGVSGNDDNTEPLIRLENERNRVQIITLHKAKGLQYPVVFLPFISLAKIKLQTVDVNEDMRLLYVGITRAKQQCILGYAPTNTKKGKEERSALKRLLFGSHQCDIDRLSIPGLTIESIIPVPDNSDTDMATEPPPLAPEDTLPQATHCQPEWQLTSYSALTRHIKTGKRFEQNELDSKRDETENEADKGPPQPATPTGIHAIPGGNKFGLLIHDLLENACELGFSHCDLDTLTTQIQHHLRYRQGLIDADQQPLLASWLHQLIHHTPLPLGDTTPTLASCPDTLAESEFYMQFDQVPLDKLQQLAARMVTPTTSQPGLPDRNGLIHGYIDLLFEYHGKYYVLDYKTNRLGDNDAAYTQNTLANAMLEHRYDVQGLVYQQALYRLLRKRLGSDNAAFQAFGGCVFFFLRGSESPSRGVYFMPPNKDVIAETDALLNATQKESA